MKLFSLILITIVLASVVPSYGQIQIDWTEIPQDIGTHWIHNGKDTITVNLGSTGGPQTWNFTTQPMGPDDTDVIIVSKSSTPFPDSFPNANLVHMIYQDSDTMYSYNELTQNFASGLGLVFMFPVILFQRFEPVDSTPLALVFGSSRSYHSGYSMVIDSHVTIRTDNYGTEVIDAYGTVTIPYGAFECLRICDFDTIIIKMLIDDIPVTFDTTTHIIYDFFAENYGLITHILSYPEETNPNYTNALFIERLTNFYTGIEENPTSTKSSFSHHPSPFSEHVTFRYSLESESYVKLSIYNASGRLVKTMVDGHQCKGNHCLKWFGKNDVGDLLPGGVYFYYLEVDETNLTGKLLLIR